MNVLASNNVNVSARQKAINYVSDALKHANSLEKLKDYRQTVYRLYVFQTTLLNSRVRLYLMGVQDCVELLKHTVDDVQDFCTFMSQTKAILSRIPEFDGAMESLWYDNSFLILYEVGMDAAKRTLRISETVERASACLRKGNVLAAHKHVLDLLACRDCLLFQVHLLRSENEAKQLQDAIVRNFESVDLLMQLIDETAWAATKHLVPFMAQDSATVVSLLRIVEREEKADALSDTRTRCFGFVTKHRPRRWKDRFFAEATQYVHRRISDVPQKSAKEDRMWLVKHLEHLRQVIAKDSDLLLSRCSRIFPPHYHALPFFLRAYREEAASHLCEIIDRGLAGNEHLSMLCWIGNDFNGERCMGQQRIVDCVGPSRAAVDEFRISVLKEGYAEFTRSEYGAYFKRILREEVSAVFSYAVSVEVDGRNVYRHIPSIFVFQLIDQKVQAALAVDASFACVILETVLTLLTEYAKQYKKQYRKICDVYFHKRTSIPFFTKQMIVASNGCMLNCKNLHSLCQTYTTAGVTSKRSASMFQETIRLFSDTLSIILNALLREIRLDLEPYMKVILKPTWKLWIDSLRTIISTFMDYFEDYRHLEPENYRKIYYRCQSLTTLSVLNALANDFAANRDAQRRLKAAKFLEWTSGRLKTIFEQLQPDGREKVAHKYPLAILDGVSRLLSAGRDELQSEIFAMQRDHPELGKVQMSRLLTARGDVTDKQIEAFTTGSAFGNGEFADLASALVSGQLDVLHEHDGSASIFDLESAQT